MAAIQEKTPSQADRLRDAEFDVFLSHAAADAELVDEAAQRLKDAGISVYVDRTEDTQLDRSAVTRETAAVLRRRMRACRILVLAVTKRSARSRWIPWELGYFDGHAGEVFVYPLDHDVRSYGTGQEYLDLYDRLEPESAATTLNARLTLLRGALFRKADAAATIDYGKHLGGQLPQLMYDPSAALRMQSEVLNAWVTLCTSWWENAQRAMQPRR
jgi:hypothetical protein